MPATPTPRLKLPLPAQTDPADVPTDLTKLATPLDTITVVFNQGTLSQRPAAGTQGRVFYATDTAPPTLYYDDGAAWQAIGPYTAPAPTALPTFKAYRAGALNFGPNTSTNIPMDTLDFDSHNGYVAASGPNGGQYRVPAGQAGTYLVNARLGLAYSATAAIATGDIWVNGSSVIRFGTSFGNSSGLWGTNGSVLLALAANDLVSVTGLHAQAATQIGIYPGRPFTALELYRIR